MKLIAVLAWCWHGVGTVLAQCWHGGGMVLAQFWCRVSVGLKHNLFSTTLSPRFFNCEKAKGVHSTLPSVCVTCYVAVQVYDFSQGPAAFMCLCHSHVSNTNYVDRFMGGCICMYMLCIKKVPVPVNTSQGYLHLLIMCAFQGVNIIVYQ